MSFLPCIVIPCYNHGAGIGGMVERLTAYGLPVFIVDDGSDPATAAVLETLAAREPLVRLSRLPENRGKGAAVMHGLRAAHDAGFSHALQIDADGQHDTDDVARSGSRSVMSSGSHMRATDLRRERTQRAALWPLPYPCVGLDRDAVIRHRRFHVRFPSVSTRYDRPAHRPGGCFQAHELRYRDTGTAGLAGRADP